ncbi:MULTISPECIES: pentapeptide repeat-containing protein [Actinosynnema]|uniref:pentapeptide repeat-containing protein n=1 Tax=Actinosynnema TaxID=40566 RepID=UPI0020A4ED58|nr:pentapeptide repeat-containing protein [Actinosynnema pretiosum]MCP2093732.1 Pentapeptide repeat-containing protein [Actinosynnema pretiosum]
MEHVWWIAGAVVSVLALALALVELRSKRKRMLAATLLGSAGAFLLVAGLLLAIDPGSPKHETIKTGGLAGGAVVALYALWLNDRRRRTDEAKHELESQRAEHDRSRVADERFAKSVELLGHDADQVRVGAMHAMAGLARSRPEYAQTVLDVLCAYLRRKPEAPDGEQRERDGEQEVRLTAQRVVADLLPAADAQDPPEYRLDLTNAHLRYFDLSHRAVGSLVMRGAVLSESNSFHHAVFLGDVWLTGTRSGGELHLHDAVFRKRAWFSGFGCEGAASFERTRFLGPTKFADARFTGTTTFDGAGFTGDADFRGARFTGGLVLPTGLKAQAHGMRVSEEHANRLPDGWKVGARGEVRS